MTTVTIRELRNRGGDVIERVLQGEQITVTRDGRPVAELRPVSRDRLSTKALQERWRHLPRMDGAALRAELDAIIDPRL